MSLSPPRGPKPVAALGWLTASVVLTLPLFVDMGDVDTVVYSMAAMAFSFEAIDIGIRLWIGHNALRPAGERAVGRERRCHPFAIAIAVRDVQSELDVLLRNLEPYKSRTWFVDDESRDATRRYLTVHGWRCVEMPTNSKKPAALKALIATLPREIETVVVLDPDAYPAPSRDVAPPELEEIVGRFQRSGAAACCPRVRFSDGNTLMAMQVLECEMAFGLGRRGLSPECVTSGVAIYERKALEQVLAEHSLSVYAEDLENSLILIGNGRRIYFEGELVIESQGKSRAAAWFSQRVGWSYGLLRVYVARARSIATVLRNGPWAFYNFAVYLGVMTILLAPLKLIGVAVLAASFANGVDALLALDLVPDNAFTNPSYFATTYLASTVLTASMLVYLRPRAGIPSLIAAAAFYSFYSAAHLVPVCVGYLNWISVRLTGRRLYKDHYTAAFVAEAAR